MSEEAKTFKVASTLTEEEIQVLKGALSPGLPMNSKAAKPYVGLYRKLIMPAEHKAGITFEPIYAETPPVVPSPSMLRSNRP